MSSINSSKSNDEFGGSGGLTSIIGLLLMSLAKCIGPTSCDINSNIVMPLVPLAQVVKPSSKHENKPASWCNTAP
jgi:hypothetical protein